MPKKPGAYHRPTDLAEALGLLAQPNSAILAGGTKLLADERGLAVDHVVDLQDLGLAQISASERTLTVGATATLTHLADYLAREQPLSAAGLWLQQLIRREGPNTYRNAATVGGTAASRLPDSELLAALLALDAGLELTGREGKRALSLAAYLEAETAPAGLITALHIPWTEGQGAADRVARTPADYAIVSAAAWRPAGGDIRLAATGIGPRPQRLPAAESRLAGGLDEDSVRAAAEAAAGACRHPGDFRGDAAYRAQMARVLTRRVLQQLA